MKSIRSVPFVAATYLFIGLVAFSGPLRGATIDSNATGDWATGATWQGGVSPGPGDTARIGIGVNHTITVSTSINAATTEIGNWGGGSTLRVADGASLTLTNDFLNNGPPGNATVFRGAGYGGSISASRLYVQFGAVLESRSGDAFSNLIQVQFSNSQFTQTSNLSPATVEIGNGSPVYTLASGTLNVTGDLGLLSLGAGSFVQTGGSVSANRLIMGSGSSAVLTQNSSFNILDIRGTGTVSNSVGGAVLTGTAANTLDTSNGIGTITLNFADVTGSGLVWGLRLLGDQTAQLTTLFGNGDLVINDSATSYNPSIFYDGSTYTYVGAAVVVPEPSALLLFGFGSIFMMCVARRRLIVR